MTINFSGNAVSRRNIKTIHSNTADHIAGVIMWLAVQLIPNHMIVTH